MPTTEVIFYRDHDGTAPAYEALRELLRRGKRKEFAKCMVRIQRLAEHGAWLRRPEADLLRDGIYELRARYRRAHHRLLYFFHGRRTAVLSHLVTKEDSVPDVEIDRAVRHKESFHAAPEAHTFRG